MKTIRRLIYGEIFIAVGFVLLAFLSLFFFFDFVDELPALGRVSPLDATMVYEIRHALLYVVLLMPSRVYELMPIAVLIGSVTVEGHSLNGFPTHYWTWVDTWVGIVDRSGSACAPHRQGQN